MNRIKEHSLLISHILCLIVVLFASLPALLSPRLEADDYRYLHHIRQVQAGNMNFVEATTVENRWDHLWFLEEEGKVRFFRPTVIASYALDQQLWGERYALGLTVSNVCIHLLCCGLAGFLFHQLLGRGLPAIGSAVLFAGLAAHSECIWYIAGRTDTLAAFGFLSAFALHVSGRRWWAVPFFIFGFITKELVIAAPLVFAFYDLFVAKRRPAIKLFVVYGLSAGLVLLIKNAALGGEGSDFVYPYLISPARPDFIEHLFLQFRSYSGNLIATEITVPFADAATVDALHHPVFSILGTGLLVIATIVSVKRPVFWLLIVFGVLTWLPTSFVYLSERYLYLPSFAFAGLLGFMITRFSGGWRALVVSLMFVYAGFQTYRLYDRHAVIMALPGSVEEMIGQLQPVESRIQQAERVYLVNLPGEFVRAQFAQDIFRVRFNNPELLVDVLTMMPGQNGTVYHPGDAYPVMGSFVEVTRKDKAIRLHGTVLSAGQPPHMIQELGMKAFNWVNMSEGRYRTDRLDVHVLEGTPAGAAALEIVPDDMRDNSIVLLWRADSSDLNAHPWERRRNSRVSVVELN